MGKWWGGFLICGIGMLVLGAPYFLFLKSLELEKQRVREKAKDVRRQHRAASRGSGEHFHRFRQRRGSERVPHGHPPVAAASTLVVPAAPGWLRWSGCREPGQLPVRRRRCLLGAAAAPVRAAVGLLFVHFFLKCKGCKGIDNCLWHLVSLYL